MSIVPKLDAGVLCLASYIGMNYFFFKKGEIYLGKVPACVGQPPGASNLILGSLFLSAFKIYMAKTGYFIL